MDYGSYIVVVVDFVHCYEETRFAVHSFASRTSGANSFLTDVSDPYRITEHTPPTDSRIFSLALRMRNTLK